MVTSESTNFAFNPDGIGLQKTGATKSFFRKLYEKPLNVAAKKIPISANEITLLGIGLAMAGSYLLEKGDYKDPQQKKLLQRIGSFLFLTGWAADLGDGAVARAKGTTSKLGALLDTGGDHIVDGFPALVALQKAHGRERAAWLIYEWIRSIPRILRHEAVGAGQNVPELSVGSRAPRTGLIFVRSLAPDKLKEAFVWASDIAALLTSLQRYQAIKRSCDKEALKRTHKTLLNYTISFIEAETNHKPNNHLKWELLQLVPILLSKSKELNGKAKKDKTS